MNCPECGKTVGKFSKFCKYCGVNLDDVRSMSYKDKLWKGRIDRKNYFAATLLVILALIVIDVTIIIVARSLKISENNLVLFAVNTVVNYVITFYYTISLDIRRAHDLGHSWKYVLLGFIPIYGIYINLRFLFDVGQDSPNKYGPKPSGKWMVRRSL